MLRDVEGLPAEEVAQRLNCSKATVRSHIANARTKFRRYMRKKEAVESMKHPESGDIGIARGWGPRARSPAGEPQRHLAKCARLPR